jgi:hypothetical protein
MLRQEGASTGFAASEKTSPGLGPTVAYFDGPFCGIPGGLKTFWNNMPDQTNWQS